MWDYLCVISQLVPSQLCEPLVCLLVSSMTKAAMVPRLPDTMVLRVLCNTAPRTFALMSMHHTCSTCRTSACTTQPSMSQCLHGGMHHRVKHKHTVCMQCTQGRTHIDIPLCINSLKGEQQTITCTLVFSCRWRLCCFGTAAVGCGSITS